MKCVQGCVSYLQSDRGQGEECSTVMQDWQTQNIQADYCQRWILFLHYHHCNLEFITVQYNGPSILLQHDPLPMDSHIGLFPGPNPMFWSSRPGSTRFFFITSVLSHVLSLKYFLPFLTMSCLLHNLKDLGKATCAPGGFPHPSWLKQKPSLMLWWPLLSPCFWNPASDWSVTSS